MGLDKKEEVGNWVSAFKGYICDPWNFLDAVHISTLLLALVVGFVVAATRHDGSSGRPFIPRPEDKINDVERMLEIIHSLNLLPSWIRVLQLLQNSQYFGTLLMTVFGMLKDCLRFFLLVIIFCFGFSCSLTPILFRKIEE